MQLCNLKNELLKIYSKMGIKSNKTGQKSAYTFNSRAGLRTRESEKHLEADLVEGCKRRGGMAIKLTSQFHRGLPDRLVLLPWRTVAFVELKSTGEKRSALQEVAARQLEALGLRVFLVDSTEALMEFFWKMDKRIARISKVVEEKGDGVQGT